MESYRDINKEMIDRWIEEDGMGSAIFHEDDLKTKAGVWDFY